VKVQVFFLDWTDQFSFDWTSGPIEDNRSFEMWQLKNKLSWAAPGF